MMRSPRLRKAALLALLLAAALSLSGCSLIVKDPAVDARQVILDVNGETVDKARFTAMFNNAYNRAYEEQQMYVQYGLIQNVNIDTDQLLKDTLDSTAQDLLLHQKARELGLDEPTDEEMALIRTQAEKSLLDIQGQVKDYFFAGSTLSEQELDAAVQAKTEELGFTLDAYIQEGKEGKLHEKLRAHLTQGLDVSEEEIRASYDEKVEQARADYEADPASYGTDLTGGQTPYYAPAGYRLIKQILVKLPDADTQAVSALQTELSGLKTALDEKQADADEYQALLAAESLNDEAAAYVQAQASALDAQEGARYAELTALESLTDAAQAELAELQAKIPVFQALETARAAHAAKEAEIAALKESQLAVLLPRAEEIRAKALAEGADFDALVREFNEDTGMPAAGYPVSASTTAFVPEFTQAALALAAPGALSEPIRTTYGWHILQYAADIPEGPAALEAVSATLRADLLKEKGDAAYNAAVEAWKAAASIRKYPERMKD